MMRMRPAAVVSPLPDPATCGAAVAASLGAALLLVAVVASAARAQTPGLDTNEVPLGAFTIDPHQDGVSVSDPPAGVSSVRTRRDGDEEPATGRWFFPSVEPPTSEDLAQSLYKDARGALDAGHLADAQRLFERLLAEAPNSAFATEARQHLGRLYRAVETGASSEQQVQPTRSAAPSVATEAIPRAVLPGAEADADAAIAGRPAVNVDPPVTHEAISHVRVSIALDEQFLSEAGDRVFFGTGSAELGTRAQGVIQAQARFLLRHPGLAAAVEGHADDGAMSAPETQRLSEERAAAVRDGLIAEGVKAERLIAFGRGRQDRVSDCPAPECLAQNRRVITILLNRHPSTGASFMRRAQSKGLPTQ